MNLTELIQYVYVVLRELFTHKFKALLGFIAVSAIMLSLGIQLPASYETSATIYADNQNILKPLLEKQAEVTKVQDRTRVVQDVLLSPRMLKDVVTALNLDVRYSDPIEQEKLIAEMRRAISVKGLGGSYIKITYQDKSPDAAFNTLNTMVDLFIKDSAKTKQTESREAFQFIDSQVKQYKEQLVDAENRLKEFRAANFDGRDSDVDSRITTLRASIEENKLLIDEAKANITALTQQISEENKYSTVRYEADLYRARLSELNQRLATMLMSYKESYPDVVSLKLQIEDMKNAVKEAENQRQEQTGSGGEQASLNPVYEDMKIKLSDAKVKLSTQTRRLEALQRLLEEEFERRKRIAERNAELAELTRDYEVTKNIYDDMLERKEKARLSMTLNIEGQGVNYKIQEPAVYPSVPLGLRFLHFVILGPVLGGLFAVAVAVFYVLADPRIRFARQVEESIAMPLLAVIPHASTPLARRVRKKDMVLVVLVGFIYCSAYVSVAVAHKAGVI